MRDKQDVGSEHSEGKSATFPQPLQLRKFILVFLIELNPSNRPRASQLKPNIPKGQTNYDADHQQWQGNYGPVQFYEVFIPKKYEFLHKTD
jgi:hypothetical protein